jgi:hypothetical protein
MPSSLKRNQFIDDASGGSLLSNDQMRLVVGLLAFS